MDARRPAHGVVEGSGDGPLADAVLANEAEGEGGEDAVGGAEDEAAVGGEEAGIEGGSWDGEVGEGEEGAREAEVEGKEADEDHEDRVHSCKKAGLEIRLSGGWRTFVRCGRTVLRGILTRGIGEFSRTRRSE